MLAYTDTHMHMFAHTHTLTHTETSVILLASVDSSSLDNPVLMLITNPNVVPSEHRRKNHGSFKTKCVASWLL